MPNKLEQHNRSPQCGSGTDALLARRLWIFDLDGTLTRPLHDFAAIRHALGVPAESGILEHIAALAEPERLAADRRLTEFELAVAQRAEPQNGAVALLYSLAQRGKQLGIVTRNRRCCVEITLERLGVAALFPAATIVACEDVERPKPDPQGIVRVLDYWRTGADQALIVGDYRFDLEAGRAAGVATVHMTADRTERWDELTDLAVPDLQWLVERQR